MLVLLSALAWAPSAFAVGEDLDQTKAQTYIDLGTTLFQGKDYAGALAEFRRAEPLIAEDTVRAVLRYNIARCLEELGRWEEAIAAFERYLARPDDRNTARKARRKLRALRRKYLGVLKVSCEPPDAKIRVRGRETMAKPCPGIFDGVEPGSYTVELIAGDLTTLKTVQVTPGDPTLLHIELAGALSVRSVTPAEVLISGQPMGSTPLQSAALEPGTHDLEVRAPGHHPWRTEVEIVAGRHLELDASLEPVPAGFPDRLEPYLRHSLAGAAGLSLLAGGVYWGLAAEDIDTFDAKLAAYEAEDESSERAAELREEADAADTSARTKRAAAFTLISLGTLLGGVAAWLYVRAEDQPASSLAPAPGGLRLRF